MGSSLVKTSRREPAVIRSNAPGTNGIGNDGTFDGQKDNGYKVDSLTDPVSNYCKPVTVVSKTEDVKTLNANKVGNLSAKAEDERSRSSHLSGDQNYVSPVLNRDFKDSSLPKTAQAEAVGSSATGRGDSPVPGLPPIPVGENKFKTRRKKLFSGSCVSRQNDPVPVPTNREPSAAPRIRDAIKPNENTRLAKSVAFVSSDQDVSRDARTPSPEYKPLKKVNATEPASLNLRTSASSPIEFYVYTEESKSVEEIPSPRVLIKKSHAPTPLNLGMKKPELTKKLHPVRSPQTYSLERPEMHLTGEGDVPTPTTLEAPSKTKMQREHSEKSGKEDDILQPHADSAIAEGEIFQQYKKQRIKDNSRDEKRVQNECDDENTLQFSESFGAYGDSGTGFPQTNSVSHRPESKENHAIGDETTIKDVEADKIGSSVGENPALGPIESDVRNPAGDGGKKYENNQQVYLCAVGSYGSHPVIDGTGQQGCVSCSSETKCISDFENGDDLSKTFRLTSDPVEAPGNLGNKDLKPLPESLLENEVKHNAESHSAPPEGKDEERKCKDNANITNQTRSLHSQHPESGADGKPYVVDMQRPISRSLGTLGFRPGEEQDPHASGDDTTWASGGAMGGLTTLSMARSTLPSASPSPSSTSLPREGRPKTPMEQDIACPAEEMTSSYMSSASIYGSYVTSVPVRTPSRTSLSGKKELSKITGTDERPSSLTHNLTGGKLLRSRPSSSQSSHKSDEAVGEACNPTSRQSLTRISAQASRHSLSHSVSNHSSCDRASVHSPRPPSTDLARLSPRPPSTQIGESGNITRRIRSRNSLISQAGSRSLSAKETSSHDNSKDAQGLSSQSHNMPTREALCDETVTPTSLQFENPTKLPPIRTSTNCPMIHSLPPDPSNWTTPSQPVRLPPVARSGSASTSHSECGERPSALTGDSGLSASWTTTTGLLRGSVVPSLESSTGIGTGSTLTDVLCLTDKLSLMGASYTISDQSKCYTSSDRSTRHAKDKGVLITPNTGIIHVEPCVRPADPDKSKEDTPKLSVDTYVNPGIKSTEPDTTFAKQDTPSLLTSYLSQKHSAPKETLLEGEHALQPEQSDRVSTVKDFTDTKVEHSLSSTISTKWGDNKFDYSKYSSRFPDIKTDLEAYSTSLPQNDNDIHEISRGVSDHKFKYVSSFTDKLNKCMEEQPKFVVDAAPAFSKETFDKDKSTVLADAVSDSKVLSPNVSSQSDKTLDKSLDLSNDDPEIKDHSSSLSADKNGKDDATTQLGSKPVHGWKSSLPIRTDISEILEKCYTSSAKVESDATLEYNHSDNLPKANESDKNQFEVTNLGTRTATLSEVGNEFVSKLAISDTEENYTDEKCASSHEKTKDGSGTCLTVSPVHYKTSSVPNTSPIMAKYSCDATTSMPERGNTDTSSNTHTAKDNERKLLNDNLDTLGDKVYDTPNFTAGKADLALGKTDVIDKHVPDAFSETCRSEGKSDEFRVKMDSYVADTHSVDYKPTFDYKAIMEKYSTKKEDYLSPKTDISELPSGEQTSTVKYETLYVTEETSSSNKYLGGFTNSITDMKNLGSNEESLSISKVTASEANDRINSVKCPEPCKDTLNKPCYTSVTATAPFCETNFIETTPRDKSKCIGNLISSIDQENTDGIMAPVPDVTTDIAPSSDKAISNTVTNYATGIDKATSTNYSVKARDTLSNDTQSFRFSMETDSSHGTMPNSEKSPDRTLVSQIKVDSEDIAPAICPEQIPLGESTPSHPETKPEMKDVSPSSTGQKLASNEPCVTDDLTNLKEGNCESRDKTPVVNEHMSRILDDADGSKSSCASEHKSSFSASLSRPPNSDDKQKDGSFALSQEDTQGFKMLETELHKRASVPNAIDPKNNEEVSVKSEGDDNTSREIEKSEKPQSDDTKIEQNMEKSTNLGHDDTDPNRVNSFHPGSKAIEPNLDGTSHTGIDKHEVTSEKPTNLDPKEGESNVESPIHTALDECQPNLESVVECNTLESAPYPGERVHSDLEETKLNPEVTSTNEVPSSHTLSQKQEDDCKPPVQESLPTERIDTIKKQIYEEGLKPCQRDGGVAFFIPVSDTGLKPLNNSPDIGERLAKTKRTSMSYEERMLMADINRHNQLSKKKEFAVKDLINVKAATSNSTTSSTCENTGSQADRTDMSVKSDKSD